LPRTRTVGRAAPRLSDRTESLAFGDFNSMAERGSIGRNPCGHCLFVMAGYYRDDEQKVHCLAQDMHGAMTVLTVQ
jgi:hypothetical protein